LFRALDQVKTPDKRPPLVSGERRSIVKSGSSAAAMAASDGQPRTSSRPKSLGVGKRVAALSQDANVIKRGEIILPHPHAMLPLVQTL